MPTNSRPYTFDRVVRIIAALALIAGAIYLINILHNILLPFCLACLIAYMLEPVVDFFRRIFHLKGRVIAVILTLVCATVIIGAITYFFIPSTIKEIHHLEQLLQSGRSSSRSIPLIPNDIIAPIRQWINSLDITKLLSSNHLQSLVTSGTAVVTATITFLMHTVEWLLTFIYVIFVMIDYHSLMRGFMMLVPVKYRPFTTKMGNDIKSSMNHYFRGQALIALCAAVFYIIGFSIVGIPLAVVLGALVGILYMIPYFQYVTLIPVALVCLIDSMSGGAHFWGEFGECLIVYVVSQCICDYVLTPKIMGKALGLNPAVILLSLSIWGTLLGLIGMIIALPLTTLILAYYQEYFINGSDITPADKIEAKKDLEEITKLPRENIQEE